MLPSPETPQTSNILGKLASVVGLVGAALFFTGWVYRWSYFLFFQLDVTTLDLPAQSFFLIPLQVFLADSGTIAKSVAAFLLIGLAIYLSLWLISISSQLVFEKIDTFIWEFIIYTKTQRIWWLYHPLKSIQIFKISKFNSIEFLQSLLNEIIIVSWILLLLFWLARDQGLADARRDAGENSTLSTVTLIFPENRLALGRKLNDEFVNPSLQGYKIIGDRGLFNDLRLTEETDITSSNRIIWRLLIERGGWIYLFKALPENATADARPSVLAIQESYFGEQLLILSPEPSRSQ